MRRALLTAALVAAADAAAAEVIRRDIQFSLGSAATNFDYTITAPGGTFTGSDGFEQAWRTRLGTRWALSAPGWTLAPVVGADLTYRSASYADGGGLTAMGVAATLGGAWAVDDRWSTDLELALAFERADLDIQAGSGLAGSGNMRGSDMRGRVLYLLDRSWSAGIELGWEVASGSYSASGQREVTIDSAGWSAALLLVWRLSMRPAGLE